MTAGRPHHSHISPRAGHASRAPETTSTSVSAASSSVPPIPVWLAHRPVVAGLVVPYLTPQAADGRWLFGTVDQDRLWHCLAGRRCQVCGLPLERPMVLLLRERDLPRQCASEPPCHPVCAYYTSLACPMVAGRMDHYRSTPARLDDRMIPAPDTPARLGQPAEVWYQVWLDDYVAIIDPINGLPAASYAGIRPRRVRRLTPTGDQTPPADRSETP